MALDEEIFGKLNTLFTNVRWTSGSGIMALNYNLLHRIFEGGYGDVDLLLWLYPCFGFRLIKAGHSSPLVPPKSEESKELHVLDVSNFSSVCFLKLQRTFFTYTCARAFNSVEGSGWKSVDFKTLSCSIYSMISHVNLFRGSKFMLIIFPCLRDGTIATRIEINPPSSKGNMNSCSIN